MDIKTLLKYAPADMELVGKVPELQMLKIFSFHYYFNGEENELTNLEDSIFYSRNDPFNIDGVFINSKLDEDTIECVYSYYVGNSKFDPLKVKKASSYITSTIKNILNNYFVNLVKASADKLNSYLTDENNYSKNIVIRIITDAEVDEKEAFNLRRDLLLESVEYKNYEISTEIVFGDEIAQSLQSEPYPYVKFGTLIVDDPNNFAKYNNSSLICNISAKSLKELWKKEGSKGLLAMNLRYHVTGKNVDNKICETILNDPTNFWYKNNGITIVCNGFNLIGNELRLEEFSIVNGGQTTYQIGTTPFDNDFFVTCKIIRNTYEDDYQKNVFISDVAEATNTQKPIKPKDLIANRPEQRILKEKFLKENIFMEIKRGDFCDKATYKEPDQRTKNNELAQDLNSFVFFEPGQSRNSASKLFSEKEIYENIFIKHSYDIGFLKDVITLEKAIKDYQTIVTKNKNNKYDSESQNIVKNGLYYFMATIGYLLKIKYNNEYKNDTVQFLNNSFERKKRFTEMAFNHPFIKKIGNSYKERVKPLFDVFDILLSEFIKKAYELDFQQFPTLIYSNWTKNNSGFERIVSNIDAYIKVYNQNSILNIIWDAFEDIDLEQENANIDLYVDIIKAKKEDYNKDLSALEIELRNKLFTYRYDKAKALHVSETSIFSENQLVKIYKEKPRTKEALQLIIKKKNFAFYDEIVNIVVSIYGN